MAKKKSKGMVESLVTEVSIEGMRLHESITVVDSGVPGYHIYILRVHRGWIYTFYNGGDNDHSVFVPQKKS